MIDTDTDLLPPRTPRVSRMTGRIIEPARATPPVELPLVITPKPKAPPVRMGKRFAADDPRRWERYSRDFVGFVDAEIKVGETGKPFTLFDFQREIFRAAFTFDDDGRLPWDTFVYSCPKKSGKTAINALITLWWSLVMEAPNEVFVLANDMEQAQSRVFGALARIVKRNAAIKAAVRVETRKAIFSNDTVVTALASDYASAAGSNHGLVSFDELWAFTSESSRRLVEEMTPVPTRTNSIRLITTYAGYEGESDLLRELYLQGVGPDEHPDGKGERIHPTLPLFLNAEARVLTYWDRVGRLPWQTERYYQSQRTSLRPSAFLRLHENTWTTGESAFVTGEMYDGCVDADHRPVTSSVTPLFMGVDASTKGDTSAVVAVRWNAGKVELVSHKIWRPTPSEPLDIEATIEQYLRDLRARFTLTKVLCDPYQLHSTLGRLRNSGLPIEEYAQTTAHLTAMGEALLGLLTGQNLRLYPSDELRAQAMNAVAVESPRGWKIAKEKSSRKIDSVIALSMACVAASEHGPTVSGSSTESFTRSTMPTPKEEEYATGWRDPRICWEDPDPGMTPTERRMGSVEYAAWRARMTQGADVR